MKIVSITYRCGETVPLEPHGGPAFKFANVQPSVEVTVELDPSDNPAQARQELQARALKALVELKNHMIESALSHCGPAKTTQGGSWPTTGPTGGPRQVEMPPQAPQGFQGAGQQSAGYLPPQPPNSAPQAPQGIPKVDSMTF